MSDAPILTVSNVSKKYCKHLGLSQRYGVQDILAELNLWRNGRRLDLRNEEFWALDDVSFELRPGEALGIVGRNGTGKSTLLKLISGLIRPDGGRINVRGRVGALLELGMGFDPVLTGRENIYVNAAVLGLSRKQTDRIVDDVIAFANLEAFIDSPVRNYSTGMWARLGYAVAAHLKPDLLLVDEVLAVGDVAFRRKCLKHMLGYLQSGGALILVSHDPYAVQNICQRALLIENGRIVFAGPTVDTLDRYFRLIEETNGEEPGQIELQDPDDRFQVRPQAKQTEADSARSDSHETVTQPVETLPAGTAATELAEPKPDDQAGLVAIQRVEITPVKGDTIACGDGVRITVHYRSSKANDNVSWAFVIYTQDQQVCITGDVVGYSERKWQIVEGQGRLECTVLNLPLVKGSYVLKAGILDRETGVLIAECGWKSRPVRFTVQSEASPLNNLYSIAGILVTVPVEWKD
jgi:ABC-type polysaccharide/polyol phosphate transport system ATPase subunit